MRRIELNLFDYRAVALLEMMRFLKEHHRDELLDESREDWYETLKYITRTIELHEDVLRGKVW